MVFEDTVFGSYEKGERKVRRAFELYENGKIPQALTELEAALAINPSNSSWHFNKALTLDAINRFEDAISEYEIALQLNPLDLEILNSLAVDYTRAGQYDRAIGIFEHIQQIDTLFEPCYCNRIITYTEMEQHNLAEQMFYLAQQINPDCPLCYYNIGNSLFVRGRFRQAIRCWLRTAELEPKHPQINYRIAQAYWSEGDTDRAREHFLAELRTNAGDADVIFDFGLFLLEAGDIESAKEKFNRILELVPDFAAALFYLGEIAFAGCDYQQAVQLFNQALQKDNTLAGPRYRLAAVSLLAGQAQKARSYLVSEVELAPEDADVWVSMASMFLVIGQGPGACLRQTAEAPKHLLPEGEPAPLERPTNGDPDSDLDYATHCLLRAVDIDCNNTEAYYYLGLVSAVKGRLEDAVEFFSRTLEIRPDHVSALRDSASVCLAMGRSGQAAGRIKKVPASSGNDPRIRALDRKADFLCRLRPRFISHLVSRILHHATNAHH